MAADGDDDRGLGLRPPRPSPKARLIERASRHRDPLARLRARRLGLDALTGRPPALELYYEPGDPHSHLCAQVLAGLAGRLRTRADVRLVGESAAGDYPERERQRAYAIRDATRIAPARGLSFPADAQVATASARARAAAELASSADAADFAAREPAVAAILFAGEEPRTSAEPVADLLDANARRRARLGHYLPAVWQFDGEWFWGVDRLDFLEARLRERGLLDGDEPLSRLDRGAAELPALGDPPGPLEFFFSFRSPYSYLGARQMLDFHRRWPSGVVVRPVLPMAMRGITVGRAKRLYTLRDVRRLCDRLGIGFGRVSDPLGEGARRCLRVFPLADSPAQQLEYLVAAGRAVWSQGVDVATEAGLRYVCEQAGIGWDRAAERLRAGAGVGYAQRNRADLLAAGLWGVPCFRCGGFSTWGQDRFWMVEELLRRAALEASPRSG